MARILFAINNATGHISPAVTLAKTLVARGHEVIWYASSRFRSKIERSGVTVVPYKVAQDIDWEKINDLFPERGQLKGIAAFKWDMNKTLEVTMDQYKDLTVIVSEFEADIILGDVMFFAAQFVAEKTGVSYVFYSPIPLMIVSRDTPPPGTFTPNTTLPGRIVNRILNWIMFRVVLRAINREVNRCRAKLGLAQSKHVFMDMLTHHADLHLQPTIPAFEYPRSDLPDHVHFIGALLPQLPKNYTEPGWWNELRDERPVVLVTQGTIATDPDDLVNPTIQGLADEDVLIVATLSDSLLDKVKPSPLPANVRIESFIPFSCLMPHVDVMVTNGGYGGVHFALTHGVPLVVAGQTEDKVDVSMRISWSGVGINLKTNRPTPQQVRGAVKEALNNALYKNKAQEMQTDFAKYNAATRGSELIERLLQTK